MESRSAREVSTPDCSRPEDALPVDSSAPESASADAVETPAEAPAAKSAPPAEAAEAPAETAAAEPAEAAAPDADADAATVMESASKGKRKLVLPKKGGRVTGRIIQIGEDGVFVDFGGREEGVLEVREIQDAEGKPTRTVGDTVKAVVTQVEGGVKLTLKARSTGDVAGLLAAHQANTAVEGKVTGVNKGGLVVGVMGVRAFCPFSQIDRHYVENPAEFVGKKLTFRISSADGRGKNVVLSRRAYLEEEMKEKAEALRQGLEVGAVIDGIVARLRPFGAFVDLGGIDGLVHVSEISHTRVASPSDALKVGQKVKVQVVKIENLGDKGERISLSVKQLEDDPWTAAVQGLEPGQQVKGKIVRLVEFGAFVQIAPGVDGLIHVSALASDRRVEHPKDVVSTGDEVEVWIVAVDKGSRRISLSLVEPSARPAAGESRGRRDGASPRRGPRDRGESREIREYRERARVEEDGLTSMGEAFQRLREKLDT